MQKNLDKIEELFKKDVEVKEIMHNLYPKNEYKYNDESRLKYNECLFKSLNLIKYNLVSILKTYNFREENLEYVDELFIHYENELIKCGSNFEKLSSFYTNYITDISEELNDKVRQKCVGYTLGNGKHLIQESTTINELLHVIHQSIINDEETYQSMPKVTEKTNQKNSKISLYGIESKLSKEIFDEISDSPDMGDTDIISLPKSKKVLMMIRDRGHALMIEVDNSKEKNLVTFFIPKICNEEKASKLKGVRKDTIKKGYTTGSFESTKDLTAKELISFIEKVPTDKDIIKSKEVTELNDMINETITNKLKQDPKSTEIKK